MMYLSILQLLGITGASGVFGALCVSLVDHFFIKNRELKSKQWEIKRSACLDALSVIDAYLSHMNWDSVSVTKQNVGIEKVRECHNKLLLCCKKQDIANKYAEIIVKKDKFEPTILMNELRNLIREELGFGSYLSLDKDKAWIAKINH